MDRRFLRRMMLAVVFAFCMGIGLTAAGESVEAAVKKKTSPKATVVLEFTDGTKKTWKSDGKKIKLGNKELAYVYFGEYPQSQVFGNQLTKSIRNAAYDKNGVAKVNGVKYKRISKQDVTGKFTDREMEMTEFDWMWIGNRYLYFRFEPIRWRVLSLKNGEAYLMSEYGLDNRVYNIYPFKNSRWSKCSLRKWLNNDFLNLAFNENEKKLINITGKNKSNPTGDIISLPSYSDIVNTEYGFINSFIVNDYNRMCTCTEFATGMGTSLYMYNVPELIYSCEWWLRDKGESIGFAALVYSSGWADYDGIEVEETALAVRPALHLDLSSVIR